jgi:hypothetical protein
VTLFLLGPFRAVLSQPFQDVRKVELSGCSNATAKLFYQDTYLSEDKVMLSFTPVPSDSCGAGQAYNEAALSPADDYFSACGFN